MNVKIACVKETISQDVATWNKVLSSAETVACCKHLGVIRHWTSVKTSFFSDSRE